MAAPDPTLHRATHGDPAACDALVERHGGLVFGMCRRLSHDPDDCYQEVWERVFGALPGFDPSGPAPLRGWIATITRRVLIDRHRRTQTRGEVVSLEGLIDRAPAADELVDRGERAQRLERAFAALPPPQRRVVVQHHIHGVSLETLAAEEGVALGTIKSRLHRGRARLAQRLRRRP